jgi:uncharacterized RDD family membrane protein YckC
MTTPPPEREGPTDPRDPSQVQEPSAPHAPPPAGYPQSSPPPAYPGPEPPGGWQQPMAQRGGLPAGVTLASWGSRVGATLLDGLVLTAVVLLLIAPGTVLVIVNDGGALGITLIVLGVLASFVVGLLYASFLVQRDGRRNGQTLGKQWVGIRAIRNDGEPYGWGPALLRELVIKQLLFGFVGGFFLSIPTILDYLWPLWDDENRALHDMVAASHVVRP